MKLTMLERIRLLELLPDKGNNLDLKILRKLRESLSFSEEERALASIQNEYKCPFEERSPEGKVTRCENKDFFSGPTRCGAHDTEMVATGRANVMLSAGALMMQKDVHMGPRAMALCAEPIKRLNDNGQLTEGPIEDLFYKFFPEVEPE